MNTIINQSIKKGKTMALVFLSAVAMFVLFIVCNRYAKNHETGSDWERSKGMMVGWLGGLLLIMSLFTFLYFGIVTFK